MSLFILYFSSPVGVTFNLYLNFQFWSAFVPCSSQGKDAVRLTLEQIDLIRRFVDAYPSTLQFATSAKGENTCFGAV